MCVLPGKKNDVQKKAWYRIDLPQRMSRFLLEVNGKFQFNSLIHCWAFCLKSWKKGDDTWQYLISCITCRVMLLGWIAQRKGKKKANFGLTDIFGCREAHKSIAVAHSSRLPWCRDCRERLGYRHICHCEWMNSEFTRKQSAFGFSVIQSQMTLGIKVVYLKKKKSRKDRKF